MRPVPVRQRHVNVTPPKHTVVLHWPFYHLRKGRNGRPKGVHLYQHVTFEEWERLGDSAARRLEQSRIKGPRIKADKVERARISEQQRLRRNSDPVVAAVGRARQRLWRQRVGNARRREQRAAARIAKAQPKS